MRVPLTQENIRRVAWLLNNETNEHDRTASQVVNGIIENYFADHKLDALIPENAYEQAKDGLTGS